MSVEYINRIIVNKDGVYLSSRSSNDSIPFHIWRCDSLSDIYTAEGQKGLDREIIRMLYEYAELRGKDKSINRYRYAKTAPEAHDIYMRHLEQINNYYEQMEQKDKDSIWHEPTEKAKQYLSFQRKMKDKMYSEIAELCNERVYFIT